VIVQAGGFGRGGINFDAKVRRNSTDLADLAIAHITGMDVFARALLAAERILNESEYPALRQGRYQSFSGEEGARFERGECTLEQLAVLAKEHGEPRQVSGQQERYEQILTMFT